MPYSLEVIQLALAKEYGVRVSKPKLKEALESPQWIPEVGRMIAVGNNPRTIDASTHYGVFNKMSGKLFVLEGGSSWNQARLLTPEEVAKCY